MLTPEQIRKMASASADKQEEFFEIKEDRFMYIGTGYECQDITEIVNGVAKEAYTAGAKDMQERNTTLTSALNAMLTQFGMDEDEWNAATFKQARKALEATT